MDESGTLFVIAQIALGLIGFGALLIALQPKSLSTWRSEDQFRFWFFLLSGLEVVFFSLLPTVIYQFTLNAALAWRVSAALFLVVVTVHCVEAVRQALKLMKRHLQSVSGVVFAVSMSALFASEVLLLSLSLDLPVGQPGGQYALATLLYLLLAAVTFVRLLQFAGERDDE
ncbi:MAG: hypothetical protein EP347_12130 [Alphaproteobacteria bacterium]|nr:MAG: hypothetical protein EP347_12130 [Alphaproteobacteria bacterium]